jgi:Heterokaryon incompatibility protein (HET)
MPGASNCRLRNDSQTLTRVTGRTHSHIHRALKSEFREFLVLILLPSRDPSSTIECRLIHTKLNGDQLYEALSYVWGEPTFAKGILLDNKPFLITSNLEIALMRLRYPDQERTLWANAICIGQMILDERNEQVGYVREIYSHCVVDIFWLWVHKDEIKRGVEIMENLEGFDITKLRSMA